MLETKNLMIRKFSPGDWRDLYEYLSDPKVVFYEPYDVLSQEKCREAAENRANDNRFWAVCLKENQKLIGNLYLKKQAYDTYELGYVFNAEYQGRGYATESARALVDYAISDLKAHRIVAMCNPENVRSWKLMERLGMRREGVLKQNIYFKTDRENRPVWQDTFEYGILASEWDRKGY